MQASLKTPNCNPHTNVAPSLHWSKSYFLYDLAQLHCRREAFSDFLFPHFLWEPIFPFSELL